MLFRQQQPLPELKGFYRDANAFDRLLASNDRLPVYWLESCNTEEDPSGLITGISVLQPGMIGDEYYMKHGHLHVTSDSDELYVGLLAMVSCCWKAWGETHNLSRSGRATESMIPGYWVHRSVNVGDERFAQLFCFASDAGQDFSIVESAGGMKTLAAAGSGGWTTQPNPDHGGYSA